MRRITTNTPLQALVTLNDPAYIEAAQALARRMVREGGPTRSDRIRRGLTLALIRTPEPREVEALAKLGERREAYYRGHPDEARAARHRPARPPARRLGRRRARRADLREQRDPEPRRVPDQELRHGESQAMNLRTRDWRWRSIAATSSAGPGRAGARGDRSGEPAEGRDAGR